MSKSYKKNKTEYSKDSSTKNEDRKNKRLIKQFKSMQLNPRTIQYYEDDYV